jgi:hypothetical protein
MNTRLLLGSVAALIVISAPASAQNVVTGFDSTTVTRCDDCFTGSIALPFTLNYFGNNYGSTFVSNNGYITFSSGQGIFTPSGLGALYAGQPIIAPFFADVDTRPALGGFTQYGANTFNGMSAWGATWTDVGYYADHTDKTNTFQVLLVDRSDVASGDFDIYFNYDRILWETGDASSGSNGFGGSSAAAGFNAGTGAPGTYYELPGSLVNGALLDGGPNSLVAGSNIGDPGRYLFNVRNGQVIVLGAVPEPAAWAMMLLGFGFVGGAMRAARRRTVAVRYA